MKHHRPTPDFEERMQAVDFADTSHGLLVHAACGPSNCRTAVDATDDGGVTWRRVGTVPVTFQAFSFPTLLMSGRRTAVLSGAVDHSQGGGRGFVTFDGGRHWSPLKLPSFGKVAVVVGTTIWAISSHCRRGRYHQRGCTDGVYRSALARDAPFTLMSHPPTRHTLLGLAASRAGTLYLKVAVLNSAPHQGVLESADGGVTWQRRWDPCRNPQELDLQTDAQGFTVWALCMDLYGAGYAPKQMFVSTDNAATWRRQPDPEGGGYSGGLDVTSSRSAWRYGARGDIYLSVDDGRTWRDLLHGRVGGDAAGSATYWLDPFSADVAWVICVANDHRTHPFMLRTTDAGQSWQQLPLPF